MPMEQRDRLRGDGYRRRDGDQPSARERTWTAFAMARHRGADSAVRQSLAMAACLSRGARWPRSPARRRRSSSRERARSPPRAWREKYTSDSASAYPQDIPVDPAAPVKQRAGNSDNTSGGAVALPKHRFAAGTTRGRLYMPSLCTLHEAQMPKLSQPDKKKRDGGNNGRCGCLAFSSRPLVFWGSPFEVIKDVLLLWPTRFPFSFFFWTLQFSSRWNTDKGFACVAACATASGRERCGTVCVCAYKDRCVLVSPWFLFLGFTRSRPIPLGGGGVPNKGYPRRRLWWGKGNRQRRGGT